MESNFIKERITIKEEIIKKNLAKNSSSGRASTSKVFIEEPPDRLIAFEELVNEKLRQDLVEISRQVDNVCQTIADYLKIKSALKIFKTNSRDLRLQTNIGCNFYAQCNVEDASKIHLCVGTQLVDGERQNIFIEMELDEAISMVDFKEKQWTQQLDTLQKKASKIKAYIKIALETMGRMYEVDRDLLTSDT